MSSHLCSVPNLSCRALPRHPAVVLGSTTTPLFPISLLPRLVPLNVPDQPMAALGPKNCTASRRHTWPCPHTWSRSALLLCLKPLPPLCQNALTALLRPPPHPTPPPRLAQLTRFAVLNQARGIADIFDTNNHACLRR